MHAFIHSLIHSFVDQFVHSFVHSFDNSFIQSFIHSSNHSCIRSSTHSSIHSCIHLLIHSFLHSLIHSFVGNDRPSLTGPEGKANQRDRKGWTQDGSKRAPAWTRLRFSLYCFFGCLCPRDLWEPRKNHKDGQEDHGERPHTHRTPSIDLTRYCLTSIFLKRSFYWFWLALLHLNLSGYCWLWYLDPATLP